MIGNPPWGYEFEKQDATYLRSTYEVAKTAHIDSYAIFIESSYRIIRNPGYLGFITPDTFLRKKELLPVRSYLLKNTTIYELIETGPVFSQVRDTWCLVLTISKPFCGENRIVHKQISRYITSAENRLQNFGLRDWTKVGIVDQDVWKNNTDMVIGYLPTMDDQSLIRKIEKNPSLGSLDSIFRISRGEEGSKFAIKSDEFGDFFMVIPKDVERHNIQAGVKIKQSILTPTKSASLYKHPKIWLIRIQKMRWKQRLVCGFDNRRNSAAMKTLQVIVSTEDNTSDLIYLSGILASKMVNYWCVNYLADDMNQSYLSRIPIRICDKNNPTGEKSYKELISLVTHILDLHKQTPATPQEHEQLQRQIAATDRQIDALVYQLYGLTDDEIALVEGS